MLANKPKKKKPDQTFLFSAIITLLFFTFVGFLLYSNWGITHRRTELSLRIESLKKEIQDLEDKNAKLKEAVSQDYFEQVARDQLNLKKPGEEVVSVQTSTATAEIKNASKSFWQTILDKLNF